MSKEVLTHSESYVKKTNRIILAVGITSFIIFIFGVVLLIKSNKVVDDYEEPVLPTMTTRLTSAILAL